MRRCRFCGSDLEVTMVNLGNQPLCESFLTEAQVDEMERYYPLHVRVCGSCYLAQADDFVAPEAIFDEYAYFSSYSESWLRHAETYVDMMLTRFGGQDQRVIEIASNDGYLLQYFSARGLDVLGIEPSWNVAEAALGKGIPTEIAFFNETFAEKLRSDGTGGDIVVANNVLAHTPTINSFVAGVKTVLNPEGVATFEFPHLMRLIEGNQFDTIYHEHWSYISLTTAVSLFGAHDLEVFDVEELPTHGGSLRLFVKHNADDSKTVQPSVERLKETEERFGLSDLDTYRRFSTQVEVTKRRLLGALIDAKEAGLSIAGYGAAGKGNTLLNYCGIGPDFLDFIADANPYKHGRFTPGMHIPILPPSAVAEQRPDVVLVLPWNLKSEIVSQLSYVSEWGGRFLIPIPEPMYLEPASTSV